MPRTSVFAILCACDCTERFALRHGKLFLSSLTVLRRRTWRLGLWNSPYSSSGDSSMHVRAFIMLLLWGKKKYGLLKSNLWRLGLRGFSNNWLNFSFNCLFTSNILWVENDTWQKIIKVGFMLRRCRLLLAKGAFHSIWESEICFVLRIIKRNYKLKFSGLTVEKVSIPIIEYTSCICGDEVLHPGRPFAL